ncbi:MAG: hypothetical protein KDE46_13530 [Caldilineaceae bacterium]|nr:hypothetical protein [Caldilineaceae bacterium]
MPKGLPILHISLASSGDQGRRTAQIDVERPNSSWTVRRTFRQLNNIEIYSTVY